MTSNIWNQVWKESVSRVINVAVWTACGLLAVKVLLFGNLAFKNLQERLDRKILIREFWLFGSRWCFRYSFDAHCNAPRAPHWEIKNSLWRFCLSIWLCLPLADSLARPLTCKPLTCFATIYQLLECPCLCDSLCYKVVMFMRERNLLIK